MKKLIAFSLLICLFQINSFSQNQNNVDSLLTVSKSASDTTKSQAFFELSKIYWDSDLSKALDYANQCLSLSKKINFKKGIGQAYNSLGVIKKNERNYLLALDFLNKSLIIYKEIDYKKGVAKLYINIGNIYFDQGDNSGALKNYLTALSQNIAIGEKKGMASAYVSIGHVYQDLGNYPEALKNFISGSKIFEEIGDQFGMAAAYNGIGHIYGRQNNYSQAISSYQVALKIFEKLENKNQMSVLYNNIGRSYYYQGNYAKALENYQIALKIQKETNNKKLIALSMNNIGNIYTLEGQYNEALNYQLQALKMQEEIEDKKGVSLTARNIGTAYLMKKNYKKSQEYLNKALTLSVEISFIDGVSECYRWLTKLDSSQGNFKESLQNYKMFIIYRDSLFNEENTKNLVQAQMQYDFDKKEATTKAEHDKKEALALAEIKRQKLIKNFTIGGLSLAAFFSFFLVHSYNRRRKTVFEKQFSDLKMKALRAQINPHFVFNCMNSIQRYILKNDKTNAVDYLQKFATLIRLILDNSEQKTVSLKDELEMLELYMQIESLRLEHGFDYEIVANDELKEQAEIPSMILQPYVENAIWHGLANKENRGKIKIDVLKFDHTLQCVIADNGIGRKKAAELKDKSVRKHQSKGLSITQQRLEIASSRELRASSKKAHSLVEVTDLMEDNIVSGTKVTLNLPL